MQITTIPAQDQIQSGLRKLRVAYYPRVSSKSFDQLLSLNTMIKDAKEQAQANDWEIVDIYVEEGVSGVSTAKRPQLNRMLQDCKAGKIDKVIIKSVSRLGRNVVELMEIAHTLRETNVAVFFDTDRIDTTQDYDPLLLSMKAMIAEIESKNISQNMQWSVRRRFQSGTYIQGIDPYGYYHDKEGNTHVEPYEAKVVKLIFQKALEGQGTARIAESLNEDHYLTRSYKPWCQRTVAYILKNPAYTGDTIWQKRFTEPDVFPYHRVINRGEMPQYEAYEVYDQIISREDFETVQIMLDYERYKCKVSEDPFKCLNRYTFSGKIKCQCGSTFNRKITHGIVKWTCKRHARDIKKCSIKAVREEYIEQAFIRMRNRLCTNLYILEDIYSELQSYRKSIQVEQRPDEHKNALITLAEESALYNKLYAQEMIDSAFYIQKTQELEAKAEYFHRNNSIEIEEENRYNETAKLIRYLRKIEPIKEWFEPAEFDDIVKETKIIDNDTIRFRLMNDLKVEEILEVVK